jgi:uncharacterized protein YfaS (alpha-2-macroglobulin family)
MSRYYVGQVAGIKATFTDKKGDLVNPTKVVCQVKAPDGTVTKPSVAKVSTGLYEVEVPITEGGMWEAAFDGGPEHKSANRVKFRADPRDVPEPT